MEQSKVNQILRVAKMYYELKMSQQDIGAKENISKSTVSRLLKNAMDLGFVEVRIRQPHYALADLEAEFTNRFGIRKVVIAADVVENREVLVQDVCSAMAADLPKYIVDDSVVGVAWGRTLNVLIKHLPKMSRSNTLTIQLNGGASRALYESGATDIVKAFKNAIGGDGYLLPAPAIVDTPHIAGVIMGDSQISSVLQLAKRCRTAVFSVGNITERSVLYELGCFSPREYMSFKTKGAVGDVCSHYIDIDGNVADENLDGRVVGTSLEHIKKIPNKLMVAVGLEKAEAVLGALRGGYADVLYLDEPLARKVLEIDENSEDSKK